MGEHDWLERGHGGGEGLQPLIKASSGRAVDRVSIRGVLRGTTPPRKPRRRTKALVGWLLYCATAVGGTAAAFTVRDTLFPSLGAPTRRGVWATSNVDTTLATQHGSTTSMSRDAVVLEAAMQEEIIEGTATSSVDSATISTDSAAPAAENGPSSSVDNLDPGSGKGPSTVTVVDEGPASGPGPGTTIGEHPSDTSPPTTIGEPASPLTPDPNVTATTVDPSGKGGGGGGGGKGGRDHTTLP